MYSSENPLVSTMALLCVVATICYNLTTNTNQSEIEGYLKETTMYQKGWSHVRTHIKSTYDWNLPLLPVNASKIMSTIDTTSYTYEGGTEREAKFRSGASMALGKVDTTSK